MAIKKTITEKVLSANRQNAKKARGPKNTAHNSQNAIIHGVLSRKLRFENDEERSLFNNLFDEFCADHHPSGATEYSQVFEISFCSWIQQKLNAWLLQELAFADGPAQAILKTIGESYDREQVPLFGGGNSAAAARGWECQELLVRTGNRTSGEEEEFGSENVSQKTGQVVVDAKMTRTVDLILRYTAAVKRDYYRALGKLQELQRDRFELEALAGGSRESDNEN